MTTKPEVPPLSAEERAVLREEMRELSILGNVVESFTYQTVMRCLVTMDAQDAQLADYEKRDLCACSIHEAQNADFQEIISRLRSEVSDANRRASELFDELNAAQAERVELESRLREAEGRITRALGWLRLSDEARQPSDSIDQVTHAIAALQPTPTPGVDK